MKSYEALQAGIGRHADEVAKACRLSRASVYKWQEPNGDWSDSGALNPLDRMEEIMKTALDCGQGEAALEPQRWLCERFDGLYMPFPSCDISFESLQAALLASIKEFGRLAEEAGKALADGRISQAEHAGLLRAGNRLLVDVTTFLRLSAETVK